MTNLIHLHHSHYHTFKAYYTQHVSVHLRGEFPNLVSYGRLVHLMQRVLGLLCAYLFTGLGRCTGISIVDPTSIAVCNNRRIH